MHVPGTAGRANPWSVSSATPNPLSYVPAGLISISSRSPPSVASVTERSARSAPASQGARGHGHPLSLLRLRLCAAIYLVGRSAVGTVRGLKSAPETARSEVKKGQKALFRPDANPDSRAEIQQDGCKMQAESVRIMQLRRQRERLRLENGQRKETGSAAAVSSDSRPSDTGRRRTLT
jgi:hypothetical protein